MSGRKKQSPVAPIGLHISKPFHNLHSTRNPSENCMFSCKTWYRPIWPETRSYQKVLWKQANQGAYLNYDSIPSSQGVGARVMKNWLPFVLGPELAMESIPAPVCFNSLVISSSNLELQNKMIQKATVTIKHLCEGRLKKARTQGHWLAKQV